MLSTNTIYRYARPYSGKEELIDSYPNYFYFTNSKGLNMPLLESGINPIGDNLEDGRVPAILIYTNPYKAGTETTPWRDIIDSDNGYIRYFGDNKAPSLNPDTSSNKHLIRQFDMHNTSNSDNRKLASPILFFENVKVGKKIKGYRKFLGYGIISKVERIIEFDQKRKMYFPNYAFDFTVLDLAQENECFDWRWIADRRNPELKINNTLKHAPESWKKWLSKGATSISSIQRKVYKLLIVSPKMQMETNNRVNIILNQIYDYYTGKKHNFEYLAAYITEKTITNNGGSFRFGWITSKSGDGGVDYIGKIPVGKGFSSTEIIVLGQAKCIKIGDGISGHDLARTVARLKRGWIGAFVTTGIYSDKSQKEMHEDKYPILLINGIAVAETVINSMHQQGETNLVHFLNSIDTEYEGKVVNKRPEEILFDR